MQLQQFQFIHNDAKADVEKLQITTSCCCGMCFIREGSAYKCAELPGVTLFPPSRRGFPSAPLLTRVASQNLAVGRRFPSSWGLHFSRASSKEHPSGRFNSQFERRPFGASSYHISSVLVPCRFSDVPMRTGSPYLAELLDAMLVVYCVVA
ncbi:hypothetical protein D917_10370 [Trichinella nativa]|uniref:Uncharacterized protein n=1 Tax=Trichinella nativa TaxID=6335 RepID=A0A1Y3EEB8_9BILA|nr:hypothetical protein D917_10370 [Trichinella nativa]